ALGLVSMENQAASCISSRESDAGELFTSAQQAVLDNDIRRGRVGVSETFVVEVAAADLGLRVVADSQPYLCLGALGYVVGSAGPPHLGGAPAGVDGIGQRIRPEPGEGEREREIEQFGVRVRLGAAPPPAPPLQVGEIRVPAAAHSGAEID